ncbi:MAG: hypothetical protein D6732_22600, partial [Methanobacteriota archaeon]
IWGAEPPDTIPVAAELNLPPGARLIRKLQARYVGLPIEVQASAAFADISYSTVVTRTDTLDIRALQPKTVLDTVATIPKDTLRNELQ